MLRLLIDTCVHRRVAAIVITAIVALFGVHAYLETPIEAYPDVTNTQVTVISLMPGYAPEEVERQVTVPLERALNGSPGMLQMRSQSLFGLSLITITFEDDVDSFHSRTLITERMTGAELPESVRPVLAPDYTPLGEIYKFVVTSDRHSLYELRSEMEWNVSRVLRQVQGVADVLTFGGYYKEIYVEIDPVRLESFGLTLDEVNRAIASANRNVGAGFLRHGDQQMVIRSVGYLNSPEDVKKIVLKSEGGTPLTIGDVARLVQAYTPRQGAVGLDVQKEAVEGIVLLRRGQNPSRVLEGVHEKIEELNTRILPAGMKLVPFLDRTELVNNTLHTVYDNLLHGFLLVVGVVWLFLRSIRGSLIVACVIPLSLLVAFIGLYRLEMPANLISMGAIDFGIILDGAVVLVESVIHQASHRHPKNHREMVQLIVDAAFSVAKPTFFAMLIIIAALLPVFTLERVEGRIFRPLALTYSFALGGGLIFAMTLVPALCAALIQPRHAMIEEPGFLIRLRSAYSRALAWSLDRRPVILGAAAVLLLAGTLAAGKLGSEFLPELDEGDVHVFVEMPASISLAKGQGILLDMRERLLRFPEVKSILSQQGRSEDGTDNEGVNMSETFVHLKPHDQWREGLHKEQLVNAMRESLVAIPGVRFNFSQPIKDNVEEAVSGVRGKVVLKIYGADLEKMRATLEQAKNLLKAIPGVIDLDLYRESIVPQLQINLDRSALAREGITIDAAQDTIETGLAGKVVTELWQNERPVPVRAILPSSERSDKEQIGNLKLPTPSGARIPLSEVAAMPIERGRTSIEREANRRFLALKFNVEGRDLGSVVHDAMVAVDGKVTLQEGSFLVWGGEFENQQRAMGRLAVVVPIAVLIVLGLLYGALQSARSAIAILLCTPFAMTGGVFLLLAAGIPLSVSAAIGFIALLGQVSLMGLLVLSATEELRREGQSLVDAIINGAADRLRPVLMASMLALLGLLPMAVSTGIGSETQQPFAVVIVGGMFTTFFVAMLVLPVIYAYITPKRLISPEEADDMPEEST
ncbi:CusA/CzcA family heavy metal efflux RND transporter [Methylomicrobium sp. Wu6]|uniref:efflux RND transporter permease subunit n=1 Tax=Methylomicrobium sp. Wu6 TaxID=3107928 RepID=UPI002DD6B367|nr:CusA/CzcA family heavy metal efflux RND transporter [Methylomicrobium sp. Wu6]MEC4749555.1 CusA/CzcA family heavy metal efflux RND transporter [Methylomicrobium sp. Wu6]